jgi:peptidoglycan/LPS O-acetylase OafA/YrhL
MPEAPLVQAADGAAERRLPALDGLRGLMTLMVLLSHYFGELPHGIRAMMFAWIAVDMFFVLSGFLIGKLILERMAHGNFFVVFYVRRFLRIIPAYVLVATTVWLLTQRLPAWTDTPIQFPLWSYLSFTQSFLMIQAASIGAHWLAPTWTLALEEHFYLFIPALLVWTPARRLPWVLGGIALAALALRAVLATGGAHAEFASLVLLPARADILVFGLLGALAVVRARIDWQAWMTVLRLTPIVGAAGAFLLKAFVPPLFGVFAPTLIGVGCAAYLLSIVHNAPEAKRYYSPILRFFGNNGYCIYLTHLPVLGLMHGLLLGSRPDLVTPAQWLVTIAALPVAVAVGWGLTKLVEEPAMRLGRRWRWSAKVPAEAPRGRLRPA